MDSVGLGIDPWSDISRLQFYISEGDFHHGTNLTFDIAEINLLRFKSPVISQIIVPEYFLLPKTWLSISYNAMGTNSVKPGSHRLTARLTNIEGQTVAQQDQDLAGQRVIGLNTASILPGNYQLSLRVTNADGEFCSEEIREIKAIPGPNF